MFSLHDPRRPLAFYAEWTVFAILFATLVALWWVLTFGFGLPSKSSSGQRVSVPEQVVDSLITGSASTSVQKYAIADTSIVANYVMPTVALMPDPSVIYRKMTTYLHWSVENVRASSCTIAQTDSSWSTTVENPEKGEGSVESPVIMSPTSFTLTCVAQNGAQPSNSVTVRLLPDIQ